MNAVQVWFVGSSMHVVLDDGAHVVYHRVKLISTEHGNMQIKYSDSEILENPKGSIVDGRREKTSLQMVEELITSTKPKEK